MGLRQRGLALTDRRVLGILAGTVTVLTPVFVVIAYLPAVVRGSGTLIVLAMLSYGAGQVIGTAIVPRVIRRKGARAALLLGACAATAITATLILARNSHPAAIATMAALGLAAGLTIVPQQHRLFATVPALAPVAVGLNGSAIYIGSALGAGLGGLALAVGGPSAPVITATAIGALAVTVVAVVVPEHVSGRRSWCRVRRPRT